MPNKWQFYAIKDAGLWFAGMRGDEAAWTPHVENAYPMPSRDCAERWANRLNIHPCDLEIIAVDADNSTGPTRVLGISAADIPGQEAAR